MDKKKIFQALTEFGCLGYTSGLYAISNLNNSRE